WDLWNGSTKAADTSASNSDAESKEENGKPPAIVPTGTSEEKQVAVDPLGDAGSNVQQEIGKEFVAMMASETVHTTEATALATNKVLTCNFFNVDHFMNILEDDISTI
nr:hypothetical protein [Tanacetum cinerariifolium]